MAAAGGSGGWGTDISKTRGFPGHLLFMEVFETEGRRGKEHPLGVPQEQGRKWTWKAILPLKPLAVADVFWSLPVSSAPTQCALVLRMRSLETMRLFNENTYCRSEPARLKKTKKPLPLCVSRCLRSETWTSPTTPTKCWQPQLRSWRMAVLLRTRGGE